MVERTLLLKLLAGLTASISSWMPKAEVCVREAVEQACAETCVVSWYGNADNGTATASGRPFDEDELTCAHKSLPFGTIVVFYYQDNRVEAQVTDRGPYIAGREFDLSLATFERLAEHNRGILKLRYRLKNNAQEHGS